MSVINQMLQDLDRRQLGGAADGAARKPAHVRPVKPPVERRTVFWITLIVLLVACIGWIAWVAYQLKPQSLATELAYRAADEARTRQAAAPSAPPPAAMPATPAPAPAAPAPAFPAETAAPPQIEMLRLAESLSTPTFESKAAPRAPAARAAPPSRRAPAALPDGAIAKAPEKPQLERHDRVGTPGERAENEFRHAVSVLKLGRAAEAERLFNHALEIDSGHRGARQALIAMQLERGELEQARKLLQEGLAIDPAQPGFAIALARIVVERKDLSGALAVLERSSGAASEVPEFHVLRGTLLQRLGRHAEAADAYHTALQARATLPQAWVGLGISLEALNRRPEAADAFRRALAAGPISAEVKAFAEQRVRALR